MKVCFKCKVEQPRENFYKHPQMGDGLLGKCKACAKVDVRENRAKRRDYYNEYDRRRAKEPKKRESLARSIAKHRHKQVTRNQTYALVKAGKLVKKPCKVCGAARSEAHHPDYSDPMVVVWLCRQHHADEHRRLRECQPNESQ
jgi:hypothetical protein